MTFVPAVALVAASAGSACAIGRFIGAVTTLLNSVIAPRNHKVFRGAVDRVGLPPTR